MLENVKVVDVKRGHLHNLGLDEKLSMQEILANHFQKFFMDKVEDSDARISILFLHPKSPATFLMQLDCWPQLEATFHQMASPDHEYLLKRKYYHS